MAHYWHGVVLLFVAFTGCFAALFALVGSKLLPPFSNPVLQAIQQDSYYALLVPMSLPTLFIAVYASWLGLKLFRSA